MRATLFAAVLVLAAGCGKREETGGGVAPPAREEKVYTREEFRKLIDGRTQDEVLKLIGKPRRTSEVGPYQYWHYDGVTRDVVTGKLDRNVQLVFEGGRVVRMNF
jgi:outer membrane protein assembly factor BamE (lipoprotein component of BamABCDE complex)